MVNSSTSNSNVSQSVYYFILIITAVFSLYFLLKSQDFNGWWSKNENKVVLDVDQLDRYRDEDDEFEQQLSVSVKKENKVYNLKKVPLHIDIDPSIVMKADDVQVGYEELCKYVSDEGFIEGYYQTVTASLKSKRKFYAKKLAEAEGLYNAAKNKSGGSSFVVQHDTTRDRLGSIKIELKAIYDAVIKRQCKITRKSISEDLKDILDNTSSGLASLVGREDMKNFLSRQIIAFAKNHRAFSLNFQNIILYGSSGVGKTKLAEVISWVYSKSNILARPKYRVVTKADMASPFVSESGPMTRNLLYESIEAVLFFDEAYSVLQEPTVFGRGLDHGNDVIEEMVKFLDSWCGNSVFIAAGYETPMKERFLKSNEGMDRRFPYKITLSDYDTLHLTKILLGFLENENRQIEITEVNANFLYTLVDHVKCNRSGSFKLQAGDCKNLSGSIARCIGTANDQYRWGMNDNTNNMLLLRGTNQWLVTKGIEPIDAHKIR